MTKESFMRHHRNLVIWLMLGVVQICFGADTLKTRPLMKDFMGLCVHTVQFKPELYKPICRNVRDYHALNWDLGDETDFWPIFPLARNKVDWQSMYGQWIETGYEIDACILFGSFAFDAWVDPAGDAETYGFAFSRFFGPSGRNLVKSIEIGNEPGEYKDAQYRIIFKNMAKGIRFGDPKMKIVTCATVAGESHEYAKSLESIKGLEELYDVINVHSYAQLENWPTWKRSFPEDSSIPYLKNIQDVIVWRNQYAPGKEVWITEFGWDCTTKPNQKDGTFKDWVGNTDAEQARYLVRSWLVFSAMDLDRAYMYWFNDNDEAKLHAASGLTRNYQPKPSFWATAHLQKTLGQYRFEKIIQQHNNAFIYSYVHGSDLTKHVYAAWRPVGTESKTDVTIHLGNGKIVAAEKMPYTPTEPTAPTYQNTSDGTIKLQCSETPVYLWINE